MSGKINVEIEKYIRKNTLWVNLPLHIKQFLKDSPQEYNRYVYNYSLRNQLRHRDNLVCKIFKDEERYYELLIDKSINNLCLFPYHLADVITKGLRITPFNYYIEVICNFLKNEKSYDTLPNFTAADCLRVLGIGRNEYLSLAGQLKSSSSPLFRRPNPKQFLPKSPVKINIEPWWNIEVGFVLESDIKYINDSEKKLIDDLIDSGSKIVGECDYNIIHNLYRTGLIYLDVPINGEDKICIPPLRNFVMNRLSGDYFENLLYKIFVSADEHMTICELSKVLQIDLEIVKHAVSLICRLGFAKKKQLTEIQKFDVHESWRNRSGENISNPCSLNYNALLLHHSNSESSPNENDDSIPVASTSTQPSLKEQQQQQQKQIKSNNSIQPDGNASHFSFTSLQTTSSQELNKFKSNNLNSKNDLNFEIENVDDSKLNTVSNYASNNVTVARSINTIQSKSGKRVGFLFDSTLTAFLMMGNLSPGLKNHAVTMFEVGKLCEESMDTFLAELEKVSLLDAEGEGEVSRYFAHAVILRSTIIALRNAFENGLDLLRLECLEGLDFKTRDRLLEKKYKFIISASPLTGFLSHSFTIPFLGQFYRSCETSHIWSKLFYYHISGYGPPSLFLTKGTVLKTLPRLFLGYGKLLVTIVHTDSYIISSENFHNINEQLKNDCVLIQGYGIKQPGQIKYESFPFDINDPLKSHLIKHKGVQKLKDHLDLEHNCGYITFVDTGVPDIGCEDSDINVMLSRPKVRRKKSLPNNIHNLMDSDISNVQNELKQFTVPSTPVIFDMCSPTDQFEVTSFNRSKPSKASVTTRIVTPTLTTDTINNLTMNHLKTPDENYFAMTPQNSSSNVFRSEDCNEILATVFDSINLDDLKKNSEKIITKSEITKKQNMNNENYKAISNDNEHFRFYLQKENSIKNETKINEAINNDKKDECDSEMWTILDVHFGVPLFDADCNTIICEHIVKKLSSNENLEKLRSSHAMMNEKFLKFVRQCLYFENEYNDNIEVGKILQKPRINLAFENGKICYWNRK